MRSEGGALTLRTAVLVRGRDTQGVHREKATQGHSVKADACKPREVSGETKPSDILFLDSQLRELGGKNVCC